MQAPHSAEVQPKLMILGASCRAAAFSAHAGGWQVFAADMFADEDLAAIGRVKQVKNYPDGLINAAAQLPPAPCLFTGALENHPDVIAEISRERTLYGCSADALAVIRNPFRWTKVLAGANLPHLPVAQEQPAGLNAKEWLAKKHGTNHYWQRFQPGASHSAVYLAQNGRATLVGVTQQLVGESWTNAAPLTYCGSIGPLPLKEQRRMRWQAIGDAFAAGLPLTGIFGVDAIVGDDPKEVWPVEINPRYTASCEIHERAAAKNSAWRSLVNLHVAACEGRSEAEANSKSSTIFGKVILFAPQQLPIDAAWLQKMKGLEMADVPRIGTTIEQSNPICTLFVESRNAEYAYHQLKELCIFSYR